MFKDLGKIKLFAYHVDEMIVISKFSSADTISRKLTASTTADNMISLTKSMMQPRAQHGGQAQENEMLQDFIQIVQNPPVESIRNLTHYTHATESQAFCS